MQNNYEAIADHLYDIGLSQVDLLKQLHTLGRIDDDGLAEAVEQLNENIYSICTACGIRRSTANCLIDPFQLS